jgi:hypothetical protein
MVYSCSVSFERVAVNEFLVPENQPFPA